VQISVTGRHMEITDAVKEHAIDRVSNAVGDFPRVEDVHVILDIEKYMRKAEIIVQAANHIHVEGNMESDNMYASIDGAADKVERQLRRLRDKAQNHKTQESLAHNELNIKQQ